MIEDLRLVNRQATIRAAVAHIFAIAAVAGVTACGSSEADRPEDDPKRSNDITTTSAVSDAYGTSPTMPASTAATTATELTALDAMTTSEPAPAESSSLVTDDMVTRAREVIAEINSEPGPLSDYCAFNGRDPGFLDGLLAPVGASGGSWQGSISTVEDLNGSVVSCESFDVGVGVSVYSYSESDEASIQQLLDSEGISPLETDVGTVYVGPPTYFDDTHLTYPTLWRRDGVLVYVFLPSDLQLDAVTDFMTVAVPSLLANVALADL